jgi:hypothetical protein
MIQVGESLGQGGLKGWARWTGGRCPLPLKGACKRVDSELAPSGLRQTESIVRLHAPFKARPDVPTLLNHPGLGSLARPVSWGYVKDRPHRASCRRKLSSACLRPARAEFGADSTAACSVREVGNAHPSAISPRDRPRKTAFAQYPKTQKPPSTIPPHSPTMWHVFIQSQCEQKNTARQEHVGCSRSWGW